MTHTTLKSGLLQWEYTLCCFEDAKRMKETFRNPNVQLCCIDWAFAVCCEIMILRTWLMSRK